MLTKIALASVLFFAPSVALAQRINAEPDFSTQGVYGVAWVDDELRAAGRTYLARFASGSVEVTPAFGRTAPQEYPLQVSLQSIRRGSRQVLAVAPAAAPAPQLSKETVLYRHGQGIVERYDVRSDGIKQSVVFAERPAGDGDLVVRYSIATEMECAPATQAQELLFRAADFGGIRIGEVIGIDARGRQVLGHMAFDGDVLELVLPHQFVATATYPLELDPLFGPELNTGVSFDDQRPDVAYDATNNVYAVAFEFPVSTTTTDVWVMRHDAATGTRLGGTSLANRAGGRPAIANINQSDRFLIVWQTNTSGNSDIVCRGMRASDGVLTNAVTVAGTPADELTPDVGGDAFDNLDVEGLVVWNEVGVGIRGIQVTLAPGTGDPVVVGTAVTLDPTPMTSNPAISKSGGFDPSNGGRYVVAWELQGPGIAFLSAVGVDKDFNILTATALVNAGPIGNVDVDGDGTQFMLVYEQLEGAATPASDVWCLPIEFCSSGTALCAPPTGGPVANVSGDDEREPAVTCLGPMFAVAWSDANPGSTTEYRIGVTNVIPGSCQLCNSPAVTGRNPGWRSSQPALCAKRSGGVESQEGLLSWEQREVSTGNSLLRSHRYQPFTGGSVTPLAGVTGCGTGGTAGVEGPFAIGNSAFQLTLRGANQSAVLAFAVIDTLLLAPNTCGACNWINPEIVLHNLVANGDADQPLPVPCDIRLLGFTINAQWVVFTPGAAAPPCPLYNFVSASDAIRLVLTN